MRPLLRSRRIRFIGIAAALLSLLLPLSLYAQTSTSTELSTAIRAALLKDPRASSLTSVQLDAMIEALSAQAKSQGVTAQDIAYRPGTLVPLTPVSYAGSSGACTDISAAFCTLGQALGFDNPNKEVPIGLWITSGLLIFIIWHMRRNPHLAHLTGVSTPQKPPSGGPLG